METQWETLSLSQWETLSLSQWGRYRSLKDAIVEVESQRFADAKPLLRSTAARCRTPRTPRFVYTGASQHACDEGEEQTTGILAELSRSVTVSEARKEFKSREWAGWIAWLYNSVHEVLKY